LGIWFSVLGFLPFDPVLFCRIIVYRPPPKVNKRAGQRHIYPDEIRHIRQILGTTYEALFEGRWQ